MSVNVNLDPVYLSCLHPREKRYYIISLVISVIFWAIITVATVGIGLLYAGFAALAILIGHAIFISNIK